MFNGSIFIHTDRKGKPVETAKKVSMEMSPQAYETLSNLSETLGTTKADVLRIALGLMKLINKEIRDGWSVKLKKGSRVKEIVTL
jgi:hypothetical protein